MKELIDVGNLGTTPFERCLIARARRPLEKLLYINAINALYSQIASSSVQASFFQSSLASLGVTFNLAPRDLANIPLKGPAVVVANHPFGGLDGIILGAIFTSLRPDVKILGNYLLKDIPELKDMLISVDPFGRSDARRNNVKPLLEAVRWIKNGGMLLVFPGRQVSHLQFQERAISDPPWSPTVAGIVRRTQATVLPVYFGGHNSIAFHLAGIVHPVLRTLLLPRELMNKKSSEVDIRIGQPVTWRRLKHFTGDAEMINHLRLATYVLANRAPLGVEVMTRAGLNPLMELPVAPETIVPPSQPCLLKKEVAALPEDRKIAEGGNLAVYYAEAERIPTVLREIGRLREVTFRAADEGTGRSVDNDSYDDHYVHLFLWNTETEEVVGAYRLGLVPEIMKHSGDRGLYTNLLFRYRPELWKRWPHAIELGRAFIRPEYQKQHAPLLMLWRGIFQFVARRPDYTILFGPLSISRAYSHASKSAIELFVRTRMSDPNLERLVSARNPFRPAQLEGVSAKFFAQNVRHLEDLSSLVSSIEADGKGIPVLFRQYARFNFRVLAFNVNKYFSSTVDGLMYVDLTKIEPGVMRRMMGKETYDDYASYHIALAE